ncbi:MAG: 4-(cytidine 5'-diphospho)-2-C-methyl-D-erythritol kinase [Lachnospiraceae bacterium]|nr:4-(cytidine 5'-diphospho)-2-C-methyl-D-erythritol kinase [Lachnospiraceae bacterium]
MDSITRKAYAKINLGLDVIRKRPDGYHEVKMIMQTVDIWDLLTFRKISNPGIFLSADRQEIPAGADNLVYKAADLILQEYDVSGGVEIVLEKHIPVAAGMAGGSTDAAAVFHGLNQLFDLGMSLGEMQRLGVKIGADVPYCIMGGTALSEGIGEVLTPLEPPPACTLLVAKPDISVSTKFVYENLHADKLTRHPDIDGMIEAVREGNLAGITERMENVLETVTIKEYPVIQKIKKAMTGKGAENALMSGSGPTVFGIFKEENTAREAEKEIKKQGLASQVFVTAFYP